MKVHCSGPCCNHSSFEPMTAAAVVVERRADENRATKDDERRKNKQLWPV